MTTAGARRRLPIGIQTFREIREEGHYYVDKTDYARRLVEEGKHYFLSRPRRFGKSLFLDTLKELFEGNERLFRGLAVHEHWDWSVRNPVIRLDFGGGDYRSPEGLRASVAARLDTVELATGIRPRYDAPAERLAYLIRALREQSGHRVAVLVDEYDKPILDALDDPETAKANRDFLRAFYGTVKAADADTRFSFFTGVSRFTKVSLFSDLNNLIDLTLDPPYSAICGYTEADLDGVFALELPGLDRERIREWYNGYNWRGPERLYNPYDILLLFRSREFEAHWFDTATPAFLIETVKRRGVFTPSLDGVSSTRDLLSNFDVDQMATEALFFQTGYLTILDEGREAGLPIYRLGYPNREVRQSLNRHLLGALIPSPTDHLASGARLRKLLWEHDFDGVEALFRAFFAAIPYEWHTRNEIARYEGYYASVFYSYCAAAGLPVVAEDSSSRGRVDLAVRLSEAVFLFEFKVVDDRAEGGAIRQLREKGYAEKYRDLGQPIHLIGVEFSKKTRNLSAFSVAAA